MQRRSTAVSVPAATDVPLATSTKVRRKVRRQRRGGVGSSSSSSWIVHEEVKSLVVVAIITSVLTASIVWLGAKAYTALVFGNATGGNKSRPLFMRDPGNNQHRYKNKKHNHPHHQAQDSSKNTPQQGVGDDNEWEALDWNPIYRVPEAMEILGDRTDAYARLRKEIDAALPPDTTRSLQRVAELQAQYPALSTHAMTPLSLSSLSAEHHSDQITHDQQQQQDENNEDITYDIYNCPQEPPPGYPFEWNLVKDVLGHWPVTTVDEIPENKIHQGLCVFDYHADWDKALKYRQADLPYIVVNDPDVARTVERWNIPGYMSQLLGKDTRHRVEYNTNSHFMYHQAGGGGKHKRRQRRNEPQKPQGPPQDLRGRVAELQRKDVNPEMIRMTYDEWFEKANKTHVGFEEEHWYFRLIGCGFMDPDGACDQGSSEYLFDEMPFFQPRSDGRNALYFGDPDEQKGIHCRFGMKNVIAENHFDATRNAIVVLGGRRRYILSHPKQCENLALLPLGHDSARHSAVDYADPDLERYPEFADAKANEVVLEAGQVLYLPTFWFHYIVSLSINFQCNARSGMDHVNHQYIRECGFK